MVYPILETKDERVNTKAIAQGDIHLSHDQNGYKVTLKVSYDGEVSFKDTQHRLTHPGSSNTIHPTETQGLIHHKNKDLVEMLRKFDTYDYESMMFPCRCMDAKIGYLLILGL